MTATEKGEVLQLTLAQAATIWGKTPRSLTNRLSSPYPPPRAGNKKFPSDMFGAWLREEIERQTRVNLGDRGEKLDGAQEMARKNAALADKTELENEVRRGSLIEVAEVEKAWTTILSRVKSRLTAIPTSAAPLMIGLDDQVKIQKLLDSLVRDAMLELSGDWRGADTGPEDDEDE